MSRSLHGDDKLVAIFKNIPVKNPRKTAEAGRPIFDDVEHVEIRAPGGRDWGGFPATSQSHWGVDPVSGDQVIITYAERFSHQYQQFKMMQTQTKVGTPLQFVPFLTEGKRAELRALNVYTVEQLAGIEGMELKNLGPGGRELKNQAEEYMAEAKVGAVDTQLAARLEAMEARNAVLEQDLELLKKGAPPATEPAPGLDKPDADFDEMTVEQIREMIATNTGRAPIGNMSRKTLVAIAKDSQKANA